MSFRVPRITKMAENTQLKPQHSSDQKMGNLLYIPPSNIDGELSDMILRM